MRTVTRASLVRDGTRYTLEQVIDPSGVSWSVTDSTDASRGELFRFHTLKANAARNLLKRALDEKDESHGEPTDA